MFQELFGLVSLNRGILFQRRVACLLSRSRPGPAAGPRPAGSQRWVVPPAGEGVPGGEGRRQEGYGESPGHAST